MREYSGIECSREMRSISGALGPTSVEGILRPELMAEGLKLHGEVAEVWKNFSKAGEAILRH